MSEPADSVPTAAIVVPCFNGGRYLHYCLESVCRQSLARFRCVVVNDGSTDDSAAIAHAFAHKDSRVRVLRQSNRGVAAARNAGAAASDARSPYILFLDSDDVLEPSMLETTCDYLGAHPDVGMVYCRPGFIDHRGTSIPCHQIESSWGKRWVQDRSGVRPQRDDEPDTGIRAVMSLAGIIPSVSLLRRDVYERTSGWDEEFGQHYEDTDLFLRMALEARVHFLPTDLVLHRRHDGQNTANERDFARQEYRLFAKWKRAAGLTKEQRTIVRDALRFREERVIPHLGLQSARQRFREGHPLQAARFVFGATRRQLRGRMRDLIDWFGSRTP